MREAEQHSFEELQLLSAAAERHQARQVLELAQLIIAGQGDKDDWQRLQQKLINKQQAGL